MEKTKKLVLVGAGEFAQMAYEYFTDDSKYEVCAFAVEHEFRDKDEIDGIPVVDFENIADIYPPDKYEIFVAITYVQLNRARTRLFNKCKKLGYKCATYVSSQAFVWKNVKIGENTFVFENNTIQYNAEIGDNVILWSGNHIGHRSVIENNCWLTSHCVISGFCRIGENTFMGVNSTLGDNVTIPRDTVFGAGALTVKSLTDEGNVYVGSPARKLNRTAYEQFGVKEV